MLGKGATIYRPNAAAFPVNDNMPVSMPVAPGRCRGGIPRFLDGDAPEPGRSRRAQPERTRRLSGRAS